ncbi:MAG TPA: hypothetical protein VJA66_06995 [Thermoanaerobaculia bacterium]
MRAFRKRVWIAAVLVSAGASLWAQKSEKKKAPAPTPEPKPCTAAPYRQFDFWLGDWDVVDSAGKPAGKNHVVSLFDGCGLQENWESAQGARGTSLNVYDAVTGHWHQTWLDDHAGLLQLDGGLDGGKMVLVGSRPSVKDKGTRVVHRIIWTPMDDKVLQHWEFSKNEGRTWTTVFDGTYVRRKS